MTEVSTMIMRNYLASDKPHILKIYERTWGKEKYEYMSNTWDWKYHNHPNINGQNFPSLVLEKDGNVIGFQGAIPGKLKVGQNYYDALWLCDLMVDPDHRGRAGFRLMKKMMADHPTLIGQADTGEEDGAIAFKLWNKLSNNNAVITRMPLLYKRINIHHAIQERIGLASLARIIDRCWWMSQKLFCDANKFNTNRIIVRQIDRLTDTEALFLAELMQEIKNIPVRDVEYMKWRYFNSPVVQYKVLFAYKDNVPLGYIIFRSIVEGQKINARIVDFLVKEGQVEAAAALLNTVLEIFRKENLRMIGVYGSHQEIIANLLEKYGFTSKSFSSPTLPIIGQCPDQRFYNVSDWHIAYGDGDFDME